MSCGPPKLCPGKAPGLLSHSLCLRQAGPQMLSEEAHSATVLTRRCWGLVIPRFSGPLGRGLH